MLQTVIFSVVGAKLAEIGNAALNTIKKAEPMATIRRNNAVSIEIQKRTDMAVAHHP